MSDNKPPVPHGEAVRRAALPEILFLPDLGLALGTTPSGARRLVLRQGIPYVRIGHRIAVRRDALHAWFAAREASGEPAPQHPTAPRPPPWAVELLRRGRRGSKPNSGAPGDEGRKQ